MSEEIKEMNPDDKNHKKDSDGYEKICYLCHRPESKVDKMITIPNQITICSDCMQKTFDQIGMQGMPSFPGMDMMNLGSMGLEPPNEFQERHQVKTKKKKKQEKPAQLWTKWGEEVKNECEALDYVPLPEYPRWTRKRIEDVVWNMLMSGYLNCEDIIDPIVPFEESAEGFMKYVDQDPELSIKMGVTFDK